MGGTTVYARSTSQNGFDERSRDVSPKKEASMNCGDSQWNKYLTQVNDEKGAAALRSDPPFLDNLLRVL